MQPYEASLSATIHAPAEQIYAILADYRDKHPNILPKQYFTKLEVEEGGRGAGTRLRFEMNVMGRTAHFRSQVSEPEPGRVLVESNQSDTMPASVTTFRLDPLLGGKQTSVTISTVGQARDGLLGTIESYFTKRFLRQVYKQELELLASLATSQAK